MHPFMHLYNLLYAPPPLYNLYNQGDELSKVTTKAAELEDRLAHGHFLLDDEGVRCVRCVWCGV